jgi:hypothetical protein
MIITGFEALIAFIVRSLVLGNRLDTCKIGTEFGHDWI